jgi:hypothetical protein
MAKVRVSRADVYAARARIALDKQNHEESPGWVQRLAQVTLGAPVGPTQVPTDAGGSTDLPVDVQPTLNASERVLRRQAAGPRGGEMRVVGPQADEGLFATEIEPTLGQSVFPALAYELLGQELAEGPGVPWIAKVIHDSAIPVEDLNLPVVRYNRLKRLGIDDSWALLNRPLARLEDPTLGGERLFTEVKDGLIQVLTEQLGSDSSSDLLKSFLSGAIESLEVTTHLPESEAAAHTTDR